VLRGAAVTVRCDAEPDLSGECGASNHGRAPQHDEHGGGGGRALGPSPFGRYRGHFEMPILTPI